MSHDENPIEIPIFHHIGNSFVLYWNIGHKVANKLKSYQFGQILNILA